MQQLHCCSRGTNIMTSYHRESLRSKIQEYSSSSWRFHARRPFYSQYARIHSHFSLSLSLFIFFFLVRPRLFREARLNAGLAVNTLFACSMNTKRTARLGWLETRRDSTDSFIEESSLGGNELCLKRPLVQRSSGTDARHVPVLTSVLSHSSFIVEFREILSPPPARYYALSASISSFRRELHVSWHAKLLCADVILPALIDIDNRSRLWR